MPDQLFPAGQKIINLPAGIFTFSGRQHIPSDAILTGIPGLTKVVVPADQYGVSFDFHGDNLVIDGINFYGGGIHFDKAKGKNENVVLNNNEFYLDADGEHDNAITFTSGLRNSRIINNLFTGYNGSFGIYGYGRDKLRVANNEFIGITAGIHIDDFDADDSNAEFEQNYFSGLKGMGIELQTYGVRTIIQDNFYEKPNLSTERSKNDGTMAFSIIMDRSVGTIIRRNTVLAPERPDGIGCRIGFEVGGDGCVVEHNYINGINHSIAANDGYGTTDVLAQNNLILNQREAPRGRGLTLKGENGPYAVLPWDINRGRPQRNKRYDYVEVYEPVLTEDPPLPAPPPEPVVKLDIADFLLANKRFMLRYTDGSVKTFDLRDRGIRRIVARMMKGEVLAFDKKGQRYE